MADSDEDLAALGTPFEELEDDAPRKKPVPIHEQIVTDERGRRRFHGAFTGGFSAGYFNTVDTKEGWTPKTFVSSRSQKATDLTMQKPEDFMDEEDLGEFGIAPKRVVTTEKFLPTDKEGKQRKRVVGPARPSETDRSVSGIIQSSEVLQDLIVPVKMSVGVKLLTQMGWKQGQGIGPRVRRSTRKTYGCTPQSSSSKEEDEGDIYAAGLMFAPKDVKSIEYTSKDNLHGIGYSGINPKTVLINQRDWLGLEPTPTIAGIKGQGFGVGALEEEDDDIYRQDHLSNYDIDLNVSSSRKRNELHGWTGPPQTSEQGGLLSVFTKVSKPPTRKVYPPPVVPRDFVPLHKVDAKLKETQITENTQNISSTKSGNVKLTAKERGEALGEKPLPTPRKSVFDYIAEEDKTRLKESREKEKPNQQSRWSDSDNTHSSVNVPKGMVFKSSGFKPFAKDPQKQARYEHFLSGKTSDVHQPGTDSKMTEWERECEAEEFVRAATLYRPLSQTMAARFTSAKESEEPSTSEKPGFKEHKSAAKTKIFGAMTRQRFEWHPDRILCKRFNIPDPYPGSGSTGIPSGQKTKSSMDVKVVEDVKSIEYKPDDEIKDENRGDDDTKASALIAGFQAMASRPPVATQETEQPGVSSSQVETNVDENSDVVKLASMDLFKAVFAESSSESDSEESDKEEDDNEEETKDEDVDEKEKSNERDSMFQTNNTKSNDFLSQNEKVISEYPDQLEEQKKQSVYSANDTFGPALPSSNTCRSLKLTDSRESGKERERKYKQKKKKKEKSYKYMETDSEDSMEGQYERYKSKRKERSEKDIYKHKSKSKKKSHSKYSENENSEEDYRNYNKHKKKKEKKSKDERKHKAKDISKKQRGSIIDWEDYEEKTFDNSNSKKDYTKFHQEKTSERWKTDSKQGKSEDKSDDDTESGSMNQDIMSKLKNIQRLKEGRRMRAADFM